MLNVLQIAIPLVLIGMMWLVGADLCWSDVLAVRKYFGLIIVATLAQVVVIPGLAILAASGGGLSPELQVGMLLLAACPGGAISNTYTSLARGEVALSVALTALSCSLAFLTLPAVCYGGGWYWGQNLEVRVPVASLALQLTLFVLLPIAAGMWARQTWPEWVAAQQRTFARLSLLGIATVLGLVVIPEFARFVELFPRVAPRLVGLTVACAAAGWALGRILGFSSAVAATLAIEFGVRNLGVGALVGLGAFARTEYAVLAAICFLVQVPLLLLAVHLFRTRFVANPSCAPPEPPG